MKKTITILISLTSLTYAGSDWVLNIQNDSDTSYTIVGTGDNNCWHLQTLKMPGVKIPAHTPVKVISDVDMGTPGCFTFLGPAEHHAFVALNNDIDVSKTNQYYLYHQPSSDFARIRNVNNHQEDQYSYNCPIHGGEVDAYLTINPTGDSHLVNFIQCH